MSDIAWNVITELRNGEWCPAPCGVREGCGCADLIQEAIDAAIAAERERCAKIAEAVRVELRQQCRRVTLSQIDEHVAHVADSIAAKIRSGE